jgi:hypothetical protein
MGSFNVNPTTILGKIHVRTPTQAESLSSRYSFLNINNAEPNLGRPPEAVTGGTYYSSLTSSELLGIRYALLSNNHSGSAWRVWAYNNPKIATYSKEGSIGVGDNAFPINIKSFVYSNYAYDNQNNRYNSQSFSNKTFNVFALSGIYLFDSTTIGDPASAIAFIVTDTGNVGIGLEDPNERLTVNGNISSNGNFIQGSSSRVSGKNSHAENVSIVIGNNSHSEGFYSGIIGDGGHAEGTASYVGLRCNFLTYTAATRTLTFSSSVSSRINDYGTAIAGTSAILYTTIPLRFEPVQIESRDLSTGSIVLTKDVVGSNVSSSIRFLVLPPINAFPYSHAEGYYAEATGQSSHAEGYDCWSHGEASHSEGYNTFAEGKACHAEGDNSSALGITSHAEGLRTIAKGIYSHAAGAYSNALYDRSWIWHGSSNTTPVSTTKTDQFLVSAAGGVYFPGNVGIGTDTPEQALHVLKGSAGSVTAEPGSIAVFEGSGNNHITILTPDAQTGGVVFGSPSDNYGSYLSWNHDNNALKLATANPDGFMQLLTNNEAEAVRITSSGNVGIGTTEPQEKLTVVGNISATNTVITNSISSRFINLIYSPANDGSNPFIRIGETDTTGFSGFNLLYNENQNKLQLVTDFGGISLTAASIDRNANVTGPLFPLYIPLSAFNIGTNANNVNTINYTQSGVIADTELVNRFAPGKGTIEVRFALTTTSSVNNKKLRFEISPDNATWTNIVDTSDASFVSLNTYRIGILNYGSSPNTIVFQTPAQGIPDGTRSTALGTYAYTPGTSIYWRVGIGLAAGLTETMALCAGYIRVSPY